jgi:hypothetical protein
VTSSYNDRNPSIRVSRVRHDESTSNLIRHADGCNPPNTSATRAIAAFAHGSMYSPEKHRMKLALWVVRRHRPFAIVEDPELLDIFSDLNNCAVTPSQSTVSRDVREIFKMSRTNVSRILQVSTPLCNNLPADNALRHIPASCTFVLTDGLHHK